MLEWLVAHEPQARLGAFTSILAVMAIWEVMAQRKELVASKARRWFANILLVVINTGLARVLLPTAAVGAAYFAQDRDLGVMHWLQVPVPIAVLITVVFLDFAIYAQHVVFHMVPPLWRLHRVHHADLDIDVTTGSRFHPIEIILSMLIKMALVVVLGAPAAGVVLFEIMLNATAMFNHSNARLPLVVDGILRRFLVTPDMHRVHHSVLPAETNANFGFNLPWWDYLFRTYRAQPELGHDRMTIGLPDTQQPNPQSLVWMLLLPFRSIGSAQKDQAAE